MKILLPVLLFSAAMAAAPRARVTSETAALDAQRRLSAGQFHTCYAAPDGLVKCWGQNASGALGDGTTIDRNAPVTVVDAANAILNEVIEVSAGSEFTCALQANGRIFCWGRNDHGQIGDGTTTTRPRAVQAGNFNDFVHVAAGTNWVCALRQIGQVMCWGANQAGQLGNAVGAAGRLLTQPGVHGKIGANLIGGHVSGLHPWVSCPSCPSSSILLFPRVDG